MLKVPHQLEIKLI